MEAVAVLGAVGSIVGIVDVVSRTILSLRDMQSRFKKANFTLDCLVGELTSTKAALNQVRALLDGFPEDAEQYYLLSMDLSDALRSCQLLVDFIDERVSELKTTDGGTGPTFESKVRIVLDDKETTQCLKRVSRQIAALNLLITAFQRYVHCDGCLQPSLSAD